MSEEQGAPQPPRHSRSSNSIHEKDNHTNAENLRQHHKPKQFIVVRHGHHSRVPSYGRNLSKLGTGTGTGAHGKQLGTSPKDSNSSGNITSKRAGKRAAFELGSPAASDTSRPNSYKEGYGTVTNVNETMGEEWSTMIHNDSTSKFKKSPSTRSLESDGRRNSKRTVQHRAERARSKSGDRRREVSTGAGRQQQRQVQSSDQLSQMTNDKQSTTTTLPSPTPPISPTQTQTSETIPSATMIQAHQFTPNIPTRPLSPQESGEPVTATNITTPSPYYPPVTPAHSLPSSQEQPLTSRFLHLSPSSGAETGPKKALLDPPLTRSESTFSITSSAAPSRTQQKLWLQRASSQAEIAIQYPPNISSHAAHAANQDWYNHQSRAEKEFERVSREYMNVRRFKNPLADGIDRICKRGERRVIPRRSANGDASASGASNMGLSQSLKEAGEVRKGNRRDTIMQVSKDDSSVANRGGDNRGGVGDLSSRGGVASEVETLLKRMWVKGELLVSNE